MAIAAKKDKKRTSVGKDEEKLEHLGTVGGSVKWCNCSGKQCGASSKSEKQNYHMFQELHFQTYPQATKSRGPKRDLHTLVPNSLILNSQMVEATQLSTDEWIDKQSVIYTYNRMFPFFKKKGILTHATTWVVLEDTA